MTPDKPPLITDISLLVQRIQKHCPSFKKRVVESASLPDAKESNLKRPSAHVAFMGILPADSSLTDYYTGYFQQAVMERWEIIILSTDKDTMVRGKKEQRQLIQLTAEVMRAFINWCPDDGLYPQELHRRQLAMVESAEVILNDGEKLGQQIIVSIPNWLMAQDGIDPNPVDLETVQVSSETPAAKPAEKNANLTSPDE